MLVAYLVCLLVGGIFVGISVVSGLSKDTDGGLDKHLGDHFRGAPHLHVETAPHLHVETHAHPHGEGPELAEAALAGRDVRPDPQRPSRRVKRRRWPWLPIMSFRFWTFGAAFFGLTGTLLSALALTAEPTTLLVSLALGVGTGTVTSYLVHTLRTPLSDAISAADMTGATGELLFALQPGRATKIRTLVRGRQRDLLAVGDVSQAYPAGTRVMILGFNEHGAARVIPEASALSREVVRTSDTLAPTTHPAAKAHSEENS